MPEYFINVKYSADADLFIEAESEEEAKDQVQGELELLLNTPDDLYNYEIRTIKVLG